MSGIFRGVYLYATPDIHIYDFSVTTDLDESYKNVNLIVKANVTNYFQKSIGMLCVEAMLYDSNQNPVFDKPVSAEVFIDGIDTCKVQLSRFVETLLNGVQNIPTSMPLCLA